MAKKKIKHEPEENLKKEQDMAEKKQVLDAHDQAEKDIEKDPDLNLKPRQENDLDEGELAKLESGD